MIERRPSLLGAWDIATLIALAVVLVSHVLFIHNDTRVLWDPGRYYVRIPDFYWSFATVSGALQAIPDAIIDSTGWYQWIIAVGMRVFGRSPEVLEVAGVFWLGLLVGASALLARRLAGPAGGFAAAALTAAVPSITVFARFGWIHVPEAALLVTMLWIYSRDVQLDRWATVVWMVALGALTIQIRESGMVWVATLGPMILLGTRPRGDLRRPWRRVVVVGVSWGVATIPSLIRMQSYITAKLGARERYVLQTPPLKDQFAEAFSLPVTVVLAVGLVLFALQLKRRWHPVSALLLVWSLVPILLFSIFYAGFTNYTPFMPALTVAAACGLVYLNRSLALIGGLVLAVVFRAWVPTPHDSAEVGVQEDLRKLMRPLSGWGGADVAALIDASCPSDEWHSCHVVVEQGLFYPSSEEYGLLELFQLAEDRVELRTVYDQPPEGWGNYRVDAMAVFYCGMLDDGYLRRAPDALQLTLQLIYAKGLSVAYSDRADQHCDYHWFTPYGRVALPDRMPTPWNAWAVTTWSNEGAWQVNLQFQERNPQFANRRGFASAYADDIVLLSSPPEGWSPEDSAGDREQARAGLVAATQRARERFAANDSSTGQQGGGMQQGGGVQQGGGMQQGVPSPR